MPLLLRPCRWHRHPWLAHLPRVPGDGIWLDDLPLGKRGEVILHLVDRIEDAIRADEWIMPRPDLRPLPREEFDLDHLPETGHLLLGRRDDWNRLDEAARAGSDVRIVVLRAQGGAGKSTLARVWVDALRDRGLPGFERAFAWSFYSQGTREQATSADLFVAEALRFFGDRGPANRDPWEKGERLAGLVAAQRTLLVLDGLEPLQAEASDHALRGAIKDPALRTLLECLARDNPGLCLVTTRERLGGSGCDPTGVRLASIEPQADRWYDSSAVPHESRWSTSMGWRRWTTGSSTRSRRWLVGRCCGSRGWRGIIGSWRRQRRGWGITRWRCICSGRGSAAL